MKIVYKDKKARFSEPRSIYNMKGLEFVTLDTSIYIYPVNGRGSHKYRWMEIPMENVKEVIKTLQILTK